MRAQFRLGAALRSHFKQYVYTFQAFVVVACGGAVLLNFTILGGRMSQVYDKW